MNDPFHIVAVRPGTLRDVVTRTVFSRSKAKRKAAHLRLQGYDVDIRRG